MQYLNVFPDCSDNDVESSEKEEDVRNGHEFDFGIGNENRHENQTPMIPNIEIGQKVRFSNECSSRSMQYLNVFPNNITHHSTLKSRWLGLSVNTLGRLGFHP
jgi:hypothetical protein